MKNLLILIVAIALYLHFYPQPEVTKWYEAKKTMLLDAFAEFSDTSVSLKADKIFTDLQPQFKSFSTKEVSRLKEITSSKNNVSEFYNTFCKGNKVSATFHPTNQSKICRTIYQYSSML
ncbi:MAG: hypothetical protein OCD00_09775 [Colwellia sp.]